MRLAGLLEASLYHDAAEGAAMVDLYEDALGLPLVAEWPGGRALRLGDAVVLLFEREALTEREGPISAHGSAGPGHICFTVAAGEYEGWRDALGERVAITHEHRWPSGRRSFYFRDPAGNLLEVADGDLWPH